MRKKKGNECCMEKTKKTIGLILFSLLLSGCGDYNPSDDDIVDSHGDITNLNKFLQFVQSVDQVDKKQIRVVSYTLGRPNFA
jgi:hypothetical protein